MITVGTWNVQNLFRPGNDAGPDSDQDYEAKLAALAEVVTGMAPDVLAVQEVGQPEALDDLVARLDGDWHTALADPDRRGIRVGFLSRLPLANPVQTTSYADGLPSVQVNDDGDTVDEMGRPTLTARIHVRGTEVIVVSCHLKSKLLTYPGGRFHPRDESERARYGVYALNRRAAEAATLRAHTTQLLDNQGRDRPVIVLGDLNDTTHAATTTLLHGPPGSEIDTPGFARPDQGDGTRLWNLAPLIPADKRHSRTYQGRDELIDHILCSHALTDVIDSVTTLDTPTPSIGDNPHAHRNTPGSDHRPVVANFTF